MVRKKVLVVIIGIALLGSMIGAAIFLRKNDSLHYDKSYIWNVQFDSSGEILVRGKNIGTIKKDVHKLVTALNGTDAESFRTPADREPGDPPKVKLVKAEHDIAAVEIINAKYLTQRMGSSGAQAYLASVTYTLTENPSIHKVNFIFEEGDHAAPGIYSREDFARNYRIAN